MRARPSRRAGSGDTRECAPHGLPVAAKPPNLSGLVAAIRIKTALLHKIATHPSAEWPRDLETFIAAIESCDLGDTTALLVLLADLKETIRIFTGFQ